MDSWELKHAEPMRRSNSIMAWGLRRLSIGQRCRRSVCRNTETFRGRGAKQRGVRLLSSWQMILLPSPAMECPFVFEADMHPEKDPTTLNKCKPQKV
jgi:hypothetical protein